MFDSTDCGGRNPGTSWISDGGRQVGHPLHPKLHNTTTCHGIPSEGGGITASMPMPHRKRFEGDPKLLTSAALCVCIPRTPDLQYMSSLNSCKDLCSDERPMKVWGRASLNRFAFSCNVRGGAVIIIAGQKRHNIGRDYSSISSSPSAQIFPSSFSFSSSSTWPQLTSRLSLARRCAPLTAEKS